MATMTEKRVVGKADPYEKKVIIKIPMTRKEKEDVFVGLNGRTFQIQRGKEVEVPEGVAEILRNREEVMEQIIAFESQANRLDEMK